MTLKGTKQAELSGRKGQRGEETWDLKVGGTPSLVCGPTALSLQVFFHFVLFFNLSPGSCYLSQSS